MSDIVLGALIGVLSVLGGAIVTQAGSFRIEKRRELASYRVNLYEKRLEVHQQAYSWLMRIIVPLRVVVTGADGNERLAGRRRELQALGANARQWWDGSCLYLDDRSRSLVVDFIETALALGHQEEIPDTLDPIKLYLDALGAVQEGIGMKHLEAREPRAR